MTKLPPKTPWKADIGGKILKFGPDFLETVELWSTYFGLVGKPSRRTTRSPKFVDQSSKTKKIMGSNFEDNFNFLEIGELWSTFLSFLERSVNGLRDLTILWAKVQKQQSYEPKTLNLWGCDSSGA